MDKEEVSEVLTKKLGKKIVIKELELVGSGYHSDGYKATTEEGVSYFVKKITSTDLGFQFPERKVMSLLVSHSMMEKANIEPKTIGVVIKNREVEVLPEITDSTEVYHIQEYGGEGKSYIDMLEEKEGKKEVDQEDKEEIDKIVNFIAEIHKMKHPSKDKERLRALYNDCLRNVIGNPEYLLLLLNEIPESSPVLSPKKEQGEFIALMLENLHYFKNRPDRLVALQGDFWGANVFFRKDKSMFVIDYSRMPWGDAGFDIGIWMSQYVVRSHKGNKEYFINLGKYFLEKYIEKTGDKEIKKTIVYSLGLVSAMYASPVWVPGFEDSVRRTFFDHVQEMLKRKEFFWK